MKIVWDEPKRLANLDKHGFDFADVIYFEWETALITPAHSKRFKAVGRYDDGTAVVIYAELGTEAISIVSFRPANATERKTDLMAPKAFKPGRGYTKSDWDAVDSPQLTGKEIASLRPAKEVLPAEFLEAVKEARKLGRPRKADKLVAVTVRLPPDVLERWKAKGEDWRTKMAERLKG